MSAGVSRRADDMTARVLAVDEASIMQAARRLVAGGLVAFPSETVYGLGADGLNPRAVRDIFRVKGRPADHPVILHVADVDQARRLAAHWPDHAEHLARHFWPGPITLILERASGVPDEVTGGQDTVGIRVPDHPVAAALLRAFRGLGSGVIAAPSANAFGAVSPTCAEHVRRSIGMRMSDEDLILDGGTCHVGLESTIVDLSVEQPRVLRPGGIPRAALADVLGGGIQWVSAPSDEPNLPRVSGALAAHYAPHARVRLLTREQMSQVVRECLRPGCLTLGSPVDTGHGAPLDDVWQRVMPDNPQDYARKLYAALHDADGAGLSDLLIECPPTTADWEAVSDRLGRACVGSQ
jgi:L-threonylcarbamoyladenylate synthase